MIAFKNHSGFTLIETLAALAIFALAATPLFMLESSLVQRVARTSSHAEMMLEAKKFLFDARIEWQKKGAQPQPFEKDIPQKRLKLKYAPQKISQQSSLKGLSLYNERVELTWSDVQGEKRDSLIAFIYIPPQEKEGV